MSVLTVVLGACGGGDDVSRPDAVVPTPSPSTVPTPDADLSTPVATPTLMPTPTPVVGVQTAVASDRPELNVELTTLTVPVCRTDPSQGGQVGFGTVPRSAPVAGVLTDTTDHDVARALGPMASWLRGATVSADEAWVSAESDQDYARAILVEGRRVWLLCGAVAATSDSVRVHPITSSLAIALGEMQIWLSDRLETLRSDASGVRDMDDSRIRISADLRGIQESIEKLVVELGDPGLARPDDLAVMNPLLETEFDVPSGWFVLRNEIDILLAAPFAFQEEGVTGLGVPGWNAGTAVRLRRFRHEESWTLSDTEGLLDSLYIKFGEQIGQSVTELDGYAAITRTYESAEYQWISFVTATVVEHRSYLLEFGCPISQDEYCAGQLDELIDGVRLTPG